MSAWDQRIRRIEKRGCETWAEKCSVREAQSHNSWETAHFLSSCMFSLRRPTCQVHVKLKNTISNGSQQIRVSYLPLSWYIVLQWWAFILKKISLFLHWQHLPASGHILVQLHRPAEWKEDPYWLRSRRFLISIISKHFNNHYLCRRKR